MLKLLIISIILVALAVFMLSVRILFKKGGQFPNTHVSGQKALRERGISCHRAQHKSQQYVRNLKERLSVED